MMTRICSYQVYDVNTLELYTRFCIQWSYLNPRQKEAEIISDVLLRAASEPEFRNMLIKDSSKVLEQYNISPEAKSIIRNSISDLAQ
ncbi:MAG TPA: hypothetical protein VE622_01090 [Nitrososphaeraceae archaeon]|jgi:hypothetical protein|nr:hypothetical protein [Nitrososphaeraceae archaeon]